MGRWEPGARERLVVAAVDLFTEQGYDVFGVTADVLGPYLADGMNLIAFRLTKGVETGSIRPVVITYPGDRPSIPIRPTAVAAAGAAFAEGI